MQIPTWVIRSGRLRISLGYFLNCLENLVDATVDPGTRANTKTDLEIKEGRNSLTVVLPGVHTDEIHFEFDIRSYFVVLETITAPNETISFIDDLSITVAALSRHC